jgi:hypothetical protein
MLAVKNRINATFEPKAANDQLAVIAPVIALDDVPASAQAPAETATSDASWLQDWTQAWSSIATSLIDASAASMSAMGSMATAPVPARAEAPESEVSLWAQPASTPRSRSWYRAPTPNLLDPTAWGFPAPLSVYGVPVSPAMMGFGSSSFGFGQNYGSGFGLPFGQPSAFTNPFTANPFARPPENPMTAWMSSFAPQPANPWSTLNSAISKALAPSPYSAYRSDSGHAVAQILRPEPKASSGQDAVAAFWNLFAWPTPPKAN